MANKYTFVWRGSIEKYDIKLKEKTRIILKQIQEEINFEEETDTELVDVDDFNPDYAIGIFWVKSIG